MLFDGVDAWDSSCDKSSSTYGMSSLYHCNSRYPSFILKIWQTLTNIDLHKSATSDFGFAKKKRPQFYHHRNTLVRRLFPNLPCLVHFDGSLKCVFFVWADNFSASYVYHQRNRLILGDLTQHLKFSCRHRQKGRILRLSKHCKPGKTELTHRFLI